MPRCCSTSSACAPALCCSARESCQGADGSPSAFLRLARGRAPCRASGVLLLATVRSEESHAGARRNAAAVDARRFRECHRALKKFAPPSVRWCATMRALEDDAPTLTDFLPAAQRQPSVSRRRVRAHLGSTSACCTSIATVRWRPPGGDADQLQRIYRHRAPCTISCTSGFSGPALSKAGARDPSPPPFSVFVPPRLGPRRAPARRRCGRAPHRADARCESATSRG